MSFYVLVLLYELYICEIWYSCSIFHKNKFTFLFPRELNLKSFEFYKYFYVVMDKVIVNFLGVGLFNKNPYHKYEITGQKDIKILCVCVCNRPLGSVI